MNDSGMEPRRLLESLLELAQRAELEIRVLSSSAPAGHVRPTESASCRVGDRIWVVLAPNDPPAHQAAVVADALKRFRAQFLEDTFVAPGVRDYLEGR
jgi:hypothetical protein